MTGGVAPYTYSVDGGAFSATLAYTNLAAGHTIDVKDNNGCIFSTTAAISNTNGPTAIATTVVNATCGASNGTLTLGAVTGGAHYTPIQLTKSIHCYTGLYQPGSWISYNRCPGC